MAEDTFEEVPKVHARLIVEIVGKPKEHVDEAIKLKFEELSKETEIIKKEFVEAEEKENGIYSAFVEFEANFESPSKLFDFCFDKLPSTVDIISPPELKFPVKYLTDLLNDLLAKLHQVDLLVAASQQRHDFLDKNTVAVLRNFIYYLCREEGKTTEEMTKDLGIKKAELQPFIDRMIEMDSLEEKNGKYYQKKKKE